MMKNYLKIGLIGIIILGFNTACSANPLSKVFSVFQKDLVINVSFKNHKNLIRGSDVYLAEDPLGQKTSVGRVTKISLIDPQTAKVQLVIDKQHKEKLFETTRFVLISGLFAENSRSHIVAVPSFNNSNQAPLKSGSSVRGFTFLEYKLATAGEELDKILGRFREQNEEFLSQLEQYIENFNTEDFQKKMDDLINKISKFSEEQKETFKNEILPSLRKEFESMLKKLKEQNNTEKSKALEKQLTEIENIVDA